MQLLLCYDFYLNLQAMNSINYIDNNKVKKVQPFFNRIAKGIAMAHGPMVILRDLQRKLKGALKDSIVRK